MNELVALAAELQEFCSARGWKFCFIGGLAVQEWSEPRMTRDVDLTLLTGFGGEEVYIDELSRRFELRRADGKEFALRNRVLLMRNKSGLGIDVALGALPFEECAIERAREVEFTGGTKLRLCSPEDLIVMKAFANRELDWRDVRMTIARQGAEMLDWNYVFEQLEPLVILKGEPEIVKRLKELRAA